MKTLKKFMVMLVAGVMAFGSYLMLPLSKIVATVSASTRNADATVRVKSVPSTLDLSTGETSVEIPFKDVEFNIPTGTKAVRVYNGTNKVIAEFEDTTKNFVFTPSATGVYSIVYGYKDNGTFKRVSTNHTLTVVGKVTTFKFAENSEFYVPSKVPAKNGQKVYIPYPTVVLSDGTELNHGDTGYANVTIRVKDPKGNGIAHTDENGHAYIELTDASEIGLYEIRYTYSAIGQTINRDAVMTKNFDVVKKENFDTSKLTYTVTETSWTENSIRYKGEEITLPTVTVKDSASTDVTNQTYNKITVDYYVNGQKQSNENNEAYKLNGNKLTIYKDAKTDNSQYYEIVYEIKDYFGNKVKTLKHKLTNASTYRTAPTIYAVNGYDAETEKDAIVSMEYAIPSTFNYVEEVRDVITIPAIYAEDTYGSTEFTYSRKIKHSNKESVTIENLYKNGTDGDKYLANEVATYKLTEKGKYTLTYSATSKLTGKTHTVDYTIMVVDGTDGSSEKVTSTPEIKLPTIPSYVKAGETIKIDLPKVTDKDTKNTVIDERVKLEIVNENITPIYENHVLTGYNYVVPSKTEDTITFKATNDNNVVVEENIVVKIIIEDTEAPILLNSENLEVTGDKVELPTVQFDDNNKEYLEMSVAVYDPNGDYVSGIKNVKVNNTTATISGGEFTASLTGKYTIIYTAIDAYSNSTSIVFVEEVTGSTSYIQSGVDSAFPTQVEPNTKVTLPNAIFQLNGEVVNNVNYSLEVVTAAGAYTLSGKEFTAKEEGEYVFAYFIDGNKVSENYTITVKDTIKPELNLSDFRPNTIYATESAICIPSMNPTDSNETYAITDYGFKITKNGSSFKEYNSEELYEEFYEKNANGIYELKLDNCYTFVPNGNGVYVVEYYAVDYAGNKTTYKLDAINVGDVDTPEIKFNIELPSKVNKNDVISFKESDITIFDSSNNATYTVTVTGPNSESVSNTAAEGEGYAFKLTNSGDYTLTITANDGQGHTNSETKTITVLTEEYESKINTEVLGIILIIVSLMILGGVVFFFIKTRDRKPKAEKETKKD